MGLKTDAIPTDQALEFRGPCGVATRPGAGAGAAAWSRQQARSEGRLRSHHCLDRRLCSAVRRGGGMNGEWGGGGKREKNIIYY